MFMSEEQVSCEYVRFRAANNYAMNNIIQSSNGPVNKLVQTSNCSVNNLIETSNCPVNKLILDQQLSCE